MEAVPLGVGRLILHRVNLTVDLVLPGTRLVVRVEVPPEAKITL